MADIIRDYGYNQTPEEAPRVSDDEADAGMDGNQSEG